MRRRIEWRRAAEALARRLPRDRLHPAVLAWAEAAPANRRWGIGFSGGADSLALLLLVWAHWPGRRRRLLVLHFDHRLRGAESRGDAVFCRKVCAALDVEMVAGRWTGRHRRASEAEAREARLAFFERHARAVWLGHQRDDIAETMLMRLARGSGSGGLAAPRPVQPQPGGRVHLRPLLNLGKSTIAAALRATGIPWRTDSTNAGRDFFRNRIRRDVMPAWQDAARRDALGGAALSRQLLEEDDAALNAWLEELKPLAADGGLLLRRLAGKPRAVVRRALHRWLRTQPAAGELSRPAFETLLDSIQRGRPTRHSLGTEGFAVIRAGKLRFERIGKSDRRFQRTPN